MIIVFGDRRCTEKKNKKEKQNKTIKKTKQNIGLYRVCKN